MTRHSSSDSARIEALNAQYVTAFLQSDVEWYREHLHDDFVFTGRGGARMRKPQFLSATAAGSGVREFQVENLVIRFFGDTAVVQAETPYVTEEGVSGRSAYTDVWVRCEPGWRAVLANVTAMPEPGVPGEQTAPAA